MIAQHEYLAHDATALAELVAKRELTASELLEAAITRADTLHARLNAVVTRADALARVRARGPLAGPFAGVPFLVKDLFQDHAGIPASYGTKALRRLGHVPKAHSEIVRRWLDAGVVVFGATNSPEFGAKGITEPDAWGPTRNPWNLAHTPGGSSGGAAAAVASGIVPFAGASDGGGSIRIPAASTGLFGLKPGRGRTPLGPGVGEVMHGAPVNHVLTRSVRDSARMLDASAGPELGGAFRIAPPERPYVAELARPPRKLRVAFSTRSPLGSPVHAEAGAAVERMAKLLVELGHEVVPAEPAIDGNALARDFLTIWFAQLALQVAYLRREFGAALADFELDTLALAAVAEARSSTRYAEAYAQWNVYGAALGEFHAQYDVYLTPSLAQPPPTVGALKTPAWAEQAMRVGMPLGLSRLIPLAQGTIEQQIMRNLSVVPFTQLANITGVPAMSVPFGAFTGGLPCGVHFLASHGGEGLLLALAAQLEGAAPWPLLADV